MIESVGCLDVFSGCGQGLREVSQKTLEPGATVVVVAPVEGADDVPVVEALVEAAEALGRTPLEAVSRWMDFVGGDRVASLELANVEQCAICMEDLHSDVVCSLNGESDATVSRLPCGHFVHTACQDAWAATGATTCSVCRTDAGAAIGVRGLRPAEDDANYSFVARGRELGRERGTAPRPKTLYSTVGISDELPFPPEPEEDWQRKLLR